MSRENVEIVRKAYENWNRGDLDSNVDLFDDHVVMRAVEDWPEQVAYGKAAVRSFYEAYADTVRHDTVVEDLVDAGGSVVLRVRARMSGDQSGIEGDLEFSHVVTLRRGKIVLSEYFWDHGKPSKPPG